MAKARFVGAKIVVVVPVFCRVLVQRDERLHREERLASGE